jgi:hypothetical protein
MIFMPRGDSGGRATAAVNTHYPKKLISISLQECIAGARICLPTSMGLIDVCFKD